jgi:glyoxylase I family protein
MFRGVEHTAIASPDPAKLAQWYADHLEFRINYVNNGNYFVRASNGSMIEIIQSAGERGSNGMTDPGIRHLAIAVDDFDTAHAELQKRGVHFLGEPLTNKSSRLIFFADGDGNIVHIIQREQPLP